MPSFADSAVIFVIALILFGPKKLPELARQLGKLMGEFRRASNDFRMQMEDELRISEQEEQQKKLDALKAQHPTATEAAAATSEGAEAAATTGDPMAIAESGEVKMMPPSTGLPEPATSWSTYANPEIDDLPGEVALGEQVGVSSEEPASEIAVEAHAPETTHG